MDIFYPVKLFADWMTYRVFGIIPETMLAGAVNFFIYDTIKIVILLAVIIYTVSIIRSFLPPQKVRALLVRKNKYVGNVLAAMLGIITPFCTCSAIPLFLGFVQAGVPLGVTFSFLVASPMINEVALVMLWGMFGLKIALIYIFSGLVIAIISGIIIGKLKVEKLLESFVLETKLNASVNIAAMSWKDRNIYAKDYALDIIKKVWLYVVIGIGIGAWIHGYIPADFLAQYAGSGKWYAVPLATLLGIPLYSNAAGIIPLVSVLTEKGVAIGTTLAFMMAVTGLSLPEFMILRRVMKTKLILIFASIVGLGIMFTGYLFNYVIG
ncbi:MAG: permease [Candidatus Nealsonbacteria bacterium]|nr:permease [Candidatus Nealsonbacteria bacterium]